MAVLGDELDLYGLSKPGHIAVAFKQGRVIARLAPNMRNRNCNAAKVLARATTIYIMRYF
ncbi:MAG: hypothetical protein ACR652_11535 [Methylocystis sp.]|uniref:hypothetical protein n=1 Tax=Methylocystis sp. TaxID=1911079 RepID=UPI003DA6987F